MSKSKFTLTINIGSIALLVLLLAGIYNETSVTVLGQTNTSEQIQNKPSRRFNEIFDEVEPDSPESRERIRSKKLRYDQPLRTILSRSTDLTTLPDGWGAGPGGEENEPISPLPIEPNTVVVIGSISKAQSYLTESKTVIFTEFNLEIERVLKNSNTNSIISGDNLNFDNVGGKLRLRNGKTVEYGGSINLTKVGRRYLLFLRGDNNTQLFTFVNGYELREDRVFPLIEKWILYARTRKWSDKTPYKNMQEPEFIQIVLDAIQNLESTTSQSGVKPKL
jgi:hypothetical protein